ncbi:MAG: hypothetical protein Kow00105_20360 [Phycisphaeraceae bacterium]
MKSIVSEKIVLVVVLVCLVGFGTVPASGMFIDPATTPSGAQPFDTWTRGTVDTTYQQWRGPVNGGAPALNGGGENFTTMFGLNQPDNDYFNPNGIATAQYLDKDRNSTGVTSGFLMSGTQNGYSFFASADWEVLVPDYNHGLGANTTLILQIEVSGNEILVGPSTPNNPAAPNSVKVDGYDWVDHVELSRSSATGPVGFPVSDVTHWFRFELPANPAGHVIEFDTYDASFGSYVPSSVDPQSTDDIMYGHTSIIAIAVDTIARVSVLDGDLDGDGFVGIADLNIVLGNWNQTVAAGDWLSGDPSGDGFVGIEDLNTVLGNWNAGTPPADLPVPEPGALVGFLGIGGSMLMQRVKS